MIVRASAPAKLILFGEHFVVYGADALATAIDRYVTVEVSDHEEGAFAITSDSIPSIGVRLEVRDGEIVSSTSGAEEGLIYVMNAIEHIREKYDLPNGGFEIKITSDVPISAGLGSSAATCVAMIAALKSYFGIDTEVDETRKEAREVERAVQGAASPIDTAVSSYGGFIHVRGDEIAKIDRECEASGERSELEMIVAVSSCAHFARLKTKDLVERVRRRREKFPAVFAYLRETASEITRAGVEALRACDIKSLGELFFMNHGLLESIGVVSGRLSAFVSAARRAGAIGAKVTGAGASDEIGDVGSVVVLPPDARIEGALIAEGASVMRVRAGVRGLSVVEVED